MKPTLLEPSALHEICPIGRAFTKLNPHYRGKEFAESAFITQWKSLMLTGVGRILVCREGGKIAGILGFYLLDDPFVGTKTAAEAFWFVLPEYRGSHVAMSLFHEFEVMSESEGAGQLLMVHIVGDGLPDLGNFYIRNGYKLIESAYRKLLTRGTGE
jgi:GNAT superfamily N-acetyltransferase